jgi:hypothetical protein
MRNMRTDLRALESTLRYSEHRRVDSMRDQCALEGVIRQQKAVRARTEAHISLLRSRAEHRARSARAGRRVWSSCGCTWIYSCVAGQDGERSGMPVRQASGAALSDSCFPCGWRWVEADTHTSARQPSHVVGVLTRWRMKWRALGARRAHVGGRWRQDDGRRRA